MINQNTIVSLGLKKTTNGWCFKDEDRTMLIPKTTNSWCFKDEDKTMLIPKTKSERFAVEQFRVLNDKFDNRSVIQQ